MGAKLYLVVHQLEKHTSWSSPTHTRMRTTNVAIGLCILYTISFGEFTNTKTSECWFVAATMIAVWLLCLCVYAMKPVESSHFMGGVIQWRSLNPAAFDGRVSKSTYYLISSPVLVCMSLCLI